MERIGVEPIMNKLSKELIELNYFSEAVNIYKKKHVKLKIAMYCNVCKRKHHFHFGEFKNGLNNADSIQDIIDKYSWKYCIPEKRNGFIFLSNKVNIFLKMIKQIEGKKIITITTETADNYSLRSFDVIDDEDGDFQFLNKYSEILFYDMLETCFKKNYASGIIVRQFLNIKIQRNINDRTLWIPKKKLYGFSIVNGKVKIVSKEEMEIDCNTDALTGMPLEPENDVIYCQCSQMGYTIGNGAEIGKIFE
jgi:hypothetical protein